MSYDPRARILRQMADAVFESGLIYQAMKFPVSMFPVLFAIPRTAGWLAQWEETLLDPEQKIARPRQIYAGAGVRDVPAAALG